MAMPTALAIKGDEERIRSAVCDGYSTKPMGYRQFVAAVAAHLFAARLTLDPW